MKLGATKRDPKFRKKTNADPKRSKPRREVPDVASESTIIKVSIDLSETMLSELDQVAILLNISRQAVMKSFIKEGLDRHFIGQRARISNTLEKSERRN
jgi:hypothetical protein